MSVAPSAYRLESVLSAAMATLDSLRTEHGVVLETDNDVLASLAEEGIDLDTVLRRLIAAALDAKANAAAATTRMEDLRARRDRFVRQEETYRNMLQAVMTTMDLRKFVCAEASITITDGRPKVIVTDEALLCAPHVKITVTRTPDKTMILADLAAGEDVAGAVLSNGQSTLTVRSR